MWWSSHIALMTNFIARDLLTKTNNLPEDTKNIPTQTLTIIITIIATVTITVIM
jgi:hypothetical protein